MRLGWSAIVGECRVQDGSDVSDARAGEADEVVIDIGFRETAATGRVTNQAEGAGRINVAADVVGSPTGCRIRGRWRSSQTGAGVVGNVDVQAGVVCRH